MANISATEAIGAGFRVIGRNPVAVLIWGVAYLVTFGLPYFLMMGPAFPDYIALYQSMARQAVDHLPPDPARLRALHAHTMALQPVILVISLVANTVLAGAVYRAVLQPEDRRFGYLRLGRQELWLGLSSVVLVILMMVMIFALFVPIGIGAAFGKAMHGGVVAGLILGVFAVAGWVAIIWVMIRLSMATPMSFVQGRFIFAESWALTRGHAARIFLILLAVMAIIWIAEIVVVGTTWGVALAQLAKGDGRRWLMGAPPADVARRAAPVVIVAWSVLSILGMAVYAVLLAPLAEVYRQLTAGPESAPPPAFLQEQPAA